MLRIFFPVWWLTSFVATHYKSWEGPHADLPLVDKLVHFTMFFILSGSYARLRPDRRGAALVLAFALFAVYGAADEITQHWVGRGTEAFDFLADVIGIGLGLALGSTDVRRRSAPPP